MAKRWVNPGRQNRRTVNVTMRRLERSILNHYFGSPKMKTELPKG